MHKHAIIEYESSIPGNWRTIKFCGIRLYGDDGVEQLCHDFEVGNLRTKRPRDLYIGFQDILRDNGYVLVSETNYGPHNTTCIEIWNKEK